MKHILFIGGAGFIGSSIVKQFCKEDPNISISVLEPPTASLNRIDGLPIKVHRGALDNLELIESIINVDLIDTIVHLVSTITPGSNFDDYKNEFINVVFPSIRLMELCSKKDIRFVYFSSGGTIYGNHLNGDVRFKETDSSAPISYYGWSKQMMENSILFMNRTKQLRYLILRPSNPYGPGQNLNGNQGLISVALGKFINGNELEIWGDGSSVRDYIYIEDLANAVYEVLCNKSISNTTLNIGSGFGYSVNDVIDIIKETLLIDGKVKYIGSRSSDVSSVVLDCSRLKELIPFKPRELKNGIKEYIDKLGYGK